MSMDSEKTIRLHLVGGFLGSGKTTAIIHAAKLLMAQGRRVGIVTNDQGRYLVDTAFARLSGAPAVEVTGGCFCCNYTDLDAQLAGLIDQAGTEVIFAESVGSCADLVATVVKPLLSLGQTAAQPASFSVYADARLLRKRLAGEEMPFSDDVVYIFDKQIEEAGLLVINKADLLDAAALDDLRAAAQRRWPGKAVITQSALTQAGVQPWLEEIETGRYTPAAAGSLEIDYDRYGAGEARLAWLDAEVALRFPEGAGREKLIQLLAGLRGALRRRGAAIGHLKFLVQPPDAALPAKISFPTLEEDGWEASVPPVAGDNALLLVNARVEMPAGDLRQLLRDALADSGMEYSLRSEEVFHPAFPRPTHRMA